MLLVTNWPGLRVDIIKNIASCHELLGVIVEPPPRTIARIALHIKNLASLPKGPRLAALRFGPKAAEIVKLVKTTNRLQIPLHECMDINSGQTLSWVKELAPDLVLTLGWRRKFGPELLGLPLDGCVNVHPSLLPRYRGRYPIPAAILEDEIESGITYHFMNEEYDCGDILLQESVSLDERETSISLLQKCERAVTRTVLRFLDEFAANKLKPLAQDPALATDAPQLSKTEACINWYTPTSDIDRRVRALYPWFAAYAYLGLKRVEFALSTPAPIQPDVTPGKVLAVNRDSMQVATADGSLLLQKPVAGLFQRNDAAEWPADLEEGDVLTHEPAEQNSRQTYPEHSP